MTDIEAIEAGYAWGLSGSLTWGQAQIGDPPIYSREFARLRTAFLMGLQDGYYRYIRLNPDLFMTPKQAAQQCQVSLHAINLFLRNAKRSADYLEQSLAVGEGKRRVWYLHREDVAGFWFASQNRK